MPFECQTYTMVWTSWNNLLDLKERKRVSKQVGGGVVGKSSRLG